MLPSNASLKITNCTQRTVKARGRRLKSHSSLAIINSPFETTKLRVQATKYLLKGTHGRVTMIYKYFNAIIADQRRTTHKVIYQLLMATIAALHAFNSGGLSSQMSVPVHTVLLTRVGQGS